MFVSTKTAKAVWGRVPTNGMCNAVLLPEARLVVGEESSVSFTACDNDDLPVAHSVPSSTDLRSFTAFLGVTALSSPVYVGDGTYDVTLQTEFWGEDVLQMEINGSRAGAPLKVVASCPSAGRTASLTTGSLT